MEQRHTLSYNCEEYTQQTDTEREVREEGERMEYRDDILQRGGAREKYQHSEGAAGVKGEKEERGEVERVVYIMYHMCIILNGPSM